MMILPSLGFVSYSSVSFFLQVNLTHLSVLKEEKELAHYRNSAGNLRNKQMLKTIFLFNQYICTCRSYTILLSIITMFRQLSILSFRRPPQVFILSKTRAQGRGSV